MKATRKMPFSCPWNRPIWVAFCAIPGDSGRIEPLLPIADLQSILRALVLSLSSLLSLGIISQTHTFDQGDPDQNTLGRGQKSGLYPEGNGDL